MTVAICPTNRSVVFRKSVRKINSNAKRAIDAYLEVHCVMVCQNVRIIVTRIHCCAIQTKLNIVLQMNSNVQIRFVLVQI